MKKYDLTDCSIILPFEFDCKERWEHFQYQLDYFARYFINYEFIIVEYGLERKIKKEDCTGIYYLFLEGKDSFSIARICNAGVSAVKNRFFYKCDTDVLIDPKALYAALETIKNNPDLGFLLPYNGVSFNITEPLRKELMSSFAFDRLPYVKPQELQGFQQPYLSLKNKNSTGLIHLFRTDLFKNLGGYNEQFVGWGYEDDEVVNRFGKLGYPPKLLEGYNAFHLNHPRKDLLKNQVAKNFFLADMVKKIPPEELKKYIKTWNRFVS